MIASGRTTNTEWLCESSWAKACGEARGHPWLAVLPCGGCSRTLARSYSGEDETILCVHDDEGVAKGINADPHEPLSSKGRVAVPGQEAPEHGRVGLGPRIDKSYAGPLNNRQNYFVSFSGESAWPDGRDQSRTPACAA